VAPATSPGPAFSGDEMKIKFIEAPKGRDFKVGDIVELNGPLNEGYARKYINRGWAVEHVDAPSPIEAKPIEKPKATFSLKPKDGDGPEGVSR
jgi:hypothetical protein